MTRTTAELARFVPVALDLETGPALDWGDFAGVRFAEPFFDQTVERWAGGSPPPRLVRTGLDALAALDQVPSLDPTLLIFHLSHCGSTLASRLIATEPAILVVAEPGPLNALLMQAPQAFDAEEHVRLIRLLVRALGRRRFGDERHYVLKLTSWNVMRLALFRRAFPAAKLVWIEREPVEVMAATLSDPPGWLRLRHSPRIARGIFGLAPSDDAGIFCARALRAMLDEARTARDAGALVIDYRALPDAVWESILPFAGLAPDAAAIIRMREEARFSAKHVGRHLFTGDGPAKRRIDPRIRALAAEFVDPLYPTRSPDPP